MKFRHSTRSTVAITGIAYAGYFVHRPAGFVIDAADFALSGVLRRAHG